MKKQVVVSTLQQLQQKTTLKKLNKTESKHLKGGSDGIVEEETVGG